MTTSVSKVYLLQIATGKAVEAELHDGVTEQQLEDWETKWVPVLFARQQQLVRAGVPLAGWSQSRQWSWRDKMARIECLLAYQTFCIVCECVTQGMIQIDMTKSARLDGQSGKPLVYIEYLEVAPWNRTELGQQAKFGGVGSILIRAAVEHSVNEEFHGRIGLHSLPQANNFYGNTCGMMDLGPDSDYENLRYFEMTPELARSFLDNGREP